MPRSRPSLARGPVPADAWRAIVRRETRADGRFVYGVRTTGIFCRPSCASRRPLRANVVIFEGARGAVAAGFRACLRCRPTGAASSDAARAATALAEACRRFAEAGDPPRCEEVARALGLSPAGLVRLFRAHLGVTPRAYRQRLVAERARAALGSSRTVLDAAFAAGYAAPSRFYESVAGELGMTAARARRGGAGERLSFATAPCSLGRVLVAWTARGACHVGLGARDDALVAELRARFPRAELARTEEAPSWLAALVGVVDGTAPAASTVPLDVRGTAFQERVWRALVAIPPGETRTYAELATSLGVPGSARAVARACASNGLAVLVPCHRVVRTGGALAGYRWGVARKRALLDREAAIRDPDAVRTRSRTASSGALARGTSRP